MRSFGGFVLSQGMWKMRSKEGDDGFCIRGTHSPSTWT